MVLICENPDCPDVGEHKTATLPDFGGGVTVSMTALACATCGHSLSREHADAQRANDEAVERMQRRAD